NGGTTTSTVTIGVTPVNDPPVTADINLVTNEDTPVSSQVVATDADGDDLVYTLSGSATNGTVVLDAATGEFTYTPDSGFSGSDSFEVEVSDGNGGLTVSLVTVGVLDVTGPSVIVDIVADILVAGETSVVTFTFSEAISGFELSDLNVTGGGVAGLTGPV